MARRTLKKKNRYKSKRKPTTRGYVRSAMRVATLSLCGGAIIGVSALFVFGYDLLTQCEYFRAREVTVAAGSRLDTETVLQQARLAPGVNILSVNLNLVRKRLLAHPWVADAEVSRELPDRIHVRIEEHRPLAVLELGRKFLINAAGEIFKEMADGDPDRLPHVTGLEFSDIHISGQHGSDAYKAVLQVLRLGREPGTVLPAHLLKRIEVDREIGLTLHAFEQTKVIKLGYEDYPAKYERLRSTLLYLNRTGRALEFESIDLNHDHRIIVRPASPGRDTEEV